MARVSRAQRVAANRAALAPLLAGRDLTVRGVVPPARAIAQASGHLEYVEVGKCPVCKFTWRTNLTGGEVKKHGPKDKPCRGSFKPPLKHAVVLKDLYVPGERWPARWM